MRERFERLMAGRYGTDQLSQFLLGAGVVIMIINLFLRLPFLNALVLADFVWIYVRMFSRNFARQSAQNARFLNLKSRFLSNFRDIPGTVRQMRTYHIYRCPQCRQKIRIPRGRGRICITCPKCRHEFIRKS